MPPVVGQPAPDFTLPSTAGPEITLSSFRGTSNVLLAFVPAAFTKTCTAELCSFGENLDKYQKGNTQVLPISVDQVPSLKEWKEKEKMKVNPLADVKRNVSREYGVLNEDEYRSRRSYFLVDKRGILRWIWIEEHNGLRRPDEEILEQIGKLA
ncbi:MAG TPA: redoxin domain-containing protein [Gemmatimonadales bacterium]|jgi:peroxiredoxin